MAEFARGLKRTCGLFVNSVELIEMPKVTYTGGISLASAIYLWAVKDSNLQP
jgi:hypothetical protein